MTHRVNLTRVLLLTIGLAGVLGRAPSAPGIDFDFVKIADTDTTIPGGTGNFTTFGTPALDGNHVAFSGGPGLDHTGIYSFANGLARVADTNTPIPSGTGNFAEFGYPSLDGGNVAFMGYDSSSQRGVYTRVDSLVKVVDGSTAIPSGTGNFNLLWAPSYDGGNLAFWGTGTGQEGIYQNAGGLGRVADLNTAVPSGTGNFTLFEAAASFDDGNVAFQGDDSGQRGIYASTSEGLNRVADVNTPIPSGSGSFRFLRPPVIDGSNVAFKGQGLGQEGIYSDLGGLHRVADLNTPIPSGTGNFVSFGDPSFDGGNLAFRGSGPGQAGIYTTLDGSLNKVIDRTDALDGKNLSNLTGPSLGPEGLSGRNVAFEAAFEDGSSGVYVALAEHRWASGTTGSWMTADNWSFGMMPRHVVPTLITPEEGTVVTGPHTPVQLRSLTLGAINSGVAELRVKPTGQLTIDDEIHVQEKGKLYIDGVVTYRDVPDRGFQNYGEIELANGAQFNGASYMENYGLVHGDGRIDHMFWNYGTGEVHVGAGDRLRLSSGNEAAFNGGWIEVIGGELDVSGRLRNMPGTPAGTIYARDATLRFGIALENLSTVGFSFGTSDVFGDVVNNGGIISVSGDSQVTFTDDFINDGTLSISPGSTAVVFGYTGAGHTGGGRLLIEGDLRPGSSPGHSVFDGDLVLGVLANLEIELGGTLLGTEYDKVTVTGDLAANGTLDVLLTDVGEGLFSPEDGDVFDILDWGTLNGTFQNVNLPGLAPMLFWDSSQLYITGELMVTAVPEPSTLALVLSGVLVGAGLLRRRKKGHAPEHDLRTGA